MGADLRLCPVPNPTKSDVIAEAIAKAHGISWEEGSFLMDLAVVRDPQDVRDLDERGREWILWLTHRRFVELEDSMGILYFRITELGRRVVRDARKSRA